MITNIAAALELLVCVVTVRGEMHDEAYFRIRYASDPLSAYSFQNVCNSLDIKWPMLMKGGDAFGEIDGEKCRQLLAYLSKNRSVLRESSLGLRINGHQVTDLSTYSIASRRVADLEPTGTQVDRGFPWLPADLHTQLRCFFDLRGGATLPKVVPNVIQLRTVVREDGKIGLGVEMLVAGAGAGHSMLKFA